MYFELGWTDLLEKEMSTHSSSRAWKIPWTEEPGRLQSMGLQRVGHDWETSLHSLHSLHTLSLEKEMANHSSVLAWRIPWTEEPGGPWAMGSQRVGHNWSGWAFTHELIFSEELIYSSSREWKKASFRSINFLCLECFKKILKAKVSSENTYIENATDFLIYLGKDFISH